MQNFFKKEVEGESLKYIKYKKYSKQRAKIRTEKGSDQFLAMFKRNSKLMHL